MTRRLHPVARALATVGAPLLLLAALTACSARDEAVDPGTFPDGTATVAAAGEAMSDLSSVHLTIDIDPPLGSNPAIKRADLDLTIAGDAAGDLEIQPQGGAMTALKLIVIGATDANPTGDSYIFLTGAGWISYPLLSDTYDTSAILAPDRGLPKMLATASDAVTVDSDEINGVDAWKVSVVFDNATVGAIVNTDLGDAVLPGYLWIAKDDDFLVKAEVQVPETPKNVKSTVLVTLSDFNKPVTVTPPVLG